MPFIRQELTADGVNQDSRIVLGTAIIETITNDHIATISVGTSGGTGYSVGDTFDLDNGSNVPVSVNGDSFIARIRVTSETGGVVDGVELISAGAYTTLATGTDFSTTTVTGAGSGCQIDIDSIQTALWTEDRRTNFDNVDFLTDGDWLCTSVKATNPPLIGLRSDINGTDEGLQMIVGTSFDNGLPWRDQPGAPPTSDFWINVPNQNPVLYLSTTERRVNWLVTNSSLVFRQYGGMGLFLPFTDVDSNYPFPGIVHGQSTTIRDFTETWGTNNRGVLNPINFNDLGCYQYRDNLSTGWFGITEDNGAGTQPNVPALIWPSQGSRLEYSFNNAPVPTNAVGNPVPDSQDYTPGAIIGGSTGYANQYGNFNENEWYATDSGGIDSVPQGPQPFGLTNQLHFTTQAHLISVSPNDTQMIGYIDGYESVHLRGLSDFDEIQTAGGRRYVVFADTGDANLYRGVAMEIV